MDPRIIAHDLEELDIPYFDQPTGFPVLDEDLAAPHQLLALVARLWATVHLCPNLFHGLGEALSAYRLQQIVQGVVLKGFYGIGIVGSGEDGKGYLVKHFKQFKT